MNFLKICSTISSATKKDSSNTINNFNNLWIELTEIQKKQLTRPKLNPNPDQLLKSNLNQLSKSISIYRCKNKIIVL